MKKTLSLCVLALVLAFAVSMSAATLKDFSFYVYGADSTVSLQYEAEVYQWTGNLIGGNSPQGGLGAPLYTTGPLFYVGNGTFQTITISPNLALSDGRYVALLTISKPPDYAVSTGSASWGLVLFSHVAGDGGGGFNFYNNGNNYAALGTPTWDDFGDFGDLAWTAHFASGVTFDTTYAWDGSTTIQPWGSGSPGTSTYGQTFYVVPEPGSLMLLGTGVIGLAGAIRRKLF